MSGSSSEESTVQRIHKMWIDGRHPNLIRVYRHGPIQGSVYTDYAIDMELCDYNLEIYLNKEQDLPAYRIYFIMSHLTQGIKFLHDEGIVYGRLKPKNGNSF
jgi:serine/threonine protein kinase